MPHFSSFMQLIFVLVVICNIANFRLCRSQPSGAPNTQRRSVQQQQSRDDFDANNDDDDFAEFDDDEFEHTVSIQGVGKSVKHAKSNLPPIPERPVQSDGGQAKVRPDGSSPSASGDAAKPGKPVADQHQDFKDEVSIDIADDDLDTEEFESETPAHPAVPADESKSKGSAGKSPASAGDSKGLKIAEVPISLQRRWINYTSEGLMLALVLIYVTMYITGRVINQRLASTWLEYHRDLLEQEFAFVGLPGDKLENVAEQETKAPSEVMHKEYDHVFTVWCTGRAGMEGMLIQLELLRRQDLVASVVKLVRGTCDRVSFKVILDSTSTVDNFVFAVVKKQLAATLVKDMADLAYFCPERRPGDRFSIPDSFSVMSEIGEVSSAILDREFIRLLNDNEQSIELLHISDHYIRTRAEEETALNAGTAPDAKKVIIFTVRLPSNKSSQDAMRDLVPVTQFFLYLLEKLNRFHLSREGKAKSDKNRAMLQQRYLKATHIQRSEAAQQRRDDKRKAEKEKIMNENDPEKQRKYEEREYKKDLKKRGPKIKQLKVKSM